MASNLSGTDVSNRTQTADESSSPAYWAMTKSFLEPLASLRLTVALLAMGIFIVLAGTMAQVNKGIWQVTDEYFRTAFAWIDLQVFFPRHWFPRLADVPGGLYFPGGWLIGFGLAINLLAAQVVRFEIQARGRRLAAGVAVIAISVWMIWLVIVSGTNKTELGEVAAIEWSTLWFIIKGTLGVCLLATAYVLIRLDRSRKLERFLLGVVVLGLGGLVGWLFYHGQQAPVNDSSLRILWQLVKGGVAALFLLAGCALLFRQRAGVVVTHAGVALMMLGELVVGLQAVEGYMRIEEGESVNFVEERRRWELAIVDRSNPDQDRVVVVPDSVLRGGETVQNQELPFAVSNVNFYGNSSVRALKPGEASPATIGKGLKWVAEENPPSSGTDNKVDVPSAYIQLTKTSGGEALGTYLVSPHGIADRVFVDGKAYDLVLRAKRSYKPYSIELIDFRFDKYLGTTKAKNFSSDVRLTDASRGVNREVKIWMNNPLRYAGETFYQSGYATNATTGAEVTILQVVSNWSWMIPYVSCMIVAVGMLAHFSLVLLRFLKRRSEHEMTNGLPKARQKKQPRAAGMALAFPLLVVIGGAGFLASQAIPPRASDQQMRLYEFGQLPLIYEGRVKPFDTLARNSLSTISQKQTYKDSSGDRQPAIRWLLDVISQSDEAHDHKVFRIENLDLLHVLGLQRRSGFRYAINEFRDNVPELSKQVALARSREKTELTVYQRKSIELDNKIRLFSMLEQSFQTPNIRQGHEKEDLSAAMQRAGRVAALQPPLAVPSEDVEQPWESYASAWNLAYGRKLMGQDANPALEHLASIFAAYKAGNTPEFNRQLLAYRQALATGPPSQYQKSRTDFEAFFNHAQPFLWSAFLYVFAFVLACLAWLGWGEPLNRAAFWLIAMTLVVHTAALFARMYISGRPPVTNLYSSAVFIGWGCVVFGLVLEMIYRLGIGNIIATVSGFVTLLVAHYLSRSGDTFVVLQAVLDTQFWLATHVTCITLGYSTTFVAGCLGILYILLGVCTRSLNAQVGQDLTRMIYGTLCFSIFFSFIGTVLGGLWADDSWGRFWGWDPKENGALIIVLWNALILHARWGKIVRDRGLAVLAVGGNICTAWSWFGTNELGVGLHSYGFTEGVLLTLGIFCLSQVAVIAVGLLPLRTWRSNRCQQRLA